MKRTIGIGLSLFLATSAAVAQWTRADLLPRSPAQAMTYDSTRGVVVMFGGNGISETWEWNGVSWVLASMGGPSPRKKPALVYDPVRKVTVLFGGETGRYPTTQLDNETWTWNGLKWEKLHVSGPGARSDASAVFDSARGIVLVFSGRKGTAKYWEDLWEWNGSSWKEVQSGGEKPPGRDFFCFCYDESRARAIIFGGNRPGLSSNDTWKFDGTKWKKITVAGPIAYLPIMVYDSGRLKSVLLFFSSDSSPGSKLVIKSWTWDGVVRERIPASFPFSLSSYYLYDYKIGAYDAARNQIILFGPLKWTLLFKGTKWSKWKTGWQFPGSIDSMAYDAKSGRILTFHKSAGTWAWDGWGWYKLAKNSEFLSLSGTAMAFDAARGVTVLFGGGYLSQTWIWDWSASAWKLVGQNDPRPPPGRYGHAMAYNAKRREIVMFGGWGEGSSSSQFDRGTWTWDGTAWTLKSLLGPSVRFSHAMAYDSDRGVVVLFDGRRYDAATKKDIYLNDLWEYADGVWTKIDVPCPVSRWDGKMVFNESKGKITIAGETGGIYGSNIETWLYGPYRPIVTASADFNGNGKSDIAVYRYPSGEWFFSDGTSFAFGTSGDVPAAGDYNGDGKAEPAVYRPSKGRWYILGGNQYAFGLLGDIPVPGHYNGPGKAVIAVYRQSTGEWLFKGGATVILGGPGRLPICPGKLRRLQSLTNPLGKR